MTREAAAAGQAPAVEDIVPNLYGDPDWKPGQRPAKESGPRWLGCRDAMRSLHYAADSELVGLSEARAAEQYRKLVHLVETAAGGVAGDLRERASRDLRRYAIWVRLSLESLAADGRSLDPGLPAFPVLTRMPAHDSPWQPAEIAQSWVDAVLREPGDPFYQPAS